MSLFALQVRSGQEIEAKEMLKAVLKKHQLNQVKGIYALETFTEVVQQDENPIKISEFLDKNDIANYLNAKQIREEIANLRAACARMTNETCQDTRQLRKEYEEQIKQHTSALKKACGIKRIYSVLKGYLLIELTETLFELPARVRQLIQLVPKIKGMVSPYSIPEEEAEQFMRQVDLAPTVEIIMADHPEGENLSLEEETCQKVKKEETGKCDEEAKQPESERTLQPLLKKCQFLRKRKKKVISLPLPVFHLMQQSFWSLEALIRFLGLLETSQQQQLEAKG